MSTRRTAVIAALLAALAAPIAGAQPGTVRGVVYDSLARRPLAGAIVQVVQGGSSNGGLAVTADSAGAFRLDALAPGRYLVGFSHPLLDLLRVEAEPRVIDVAAPGDTVRVDLALPAFASVRPIVCGGEQARSDSSGLLAGRVRDAATDAPVAGATVTLAWSEISIGAGGAHTEHRRVPVTTRPDGGYVMCGVPAGVELVATARAPRRASGEVVLTLPPRGFVARDFALGDTAAAPSRLARIAGTVRDSAGRPLRNARIFLLGTTVATSTNDHGTFVLAGLPAGTRTIEVRAIGFAPYQLAIDLRPDATSRVDVPMHPTTVTLAAVTVRGTNEALGGFYERMRTNGFGRFITEADIARTNPFLASDALRNVRGATLVPHPRFGHIIRGRRNNGFQCGALIVLNGTALPRDQTLDQFVGPRDIAGIEWYDNEATAPRQFSQPTDAAYNVCSVLMVWTKQYEVARRP